MKIIITSEKMDELSEMTEKMLHYGGKLMACLEEMSEEGGMMGERGRGGMGMREEGIFDDKRERTEIAQRQDYGERGRGRYRY